MIEQLAINDKQWRKMSLKICKDKELADEIVQEMYLKLYNKQYQISDGLIYVVLNSLFLDVKRKKNRYIDIEFDLKDVSEEYDYEKDIEFDKILTKLPIELKKLTFIERELFLLNQTLSQRKIAEQSQIDKRYINKNIKKTKEKLWQNLKK